MAKSVLIVEDDEPTRLLLVAVMRRGGLQTVIAGNGQAAPVMGAARPVADTLHPAVSRTQCGRAVPARAGRAGGGTGCLRRCGRSPAAPQALEGRLDGHHGMSVYRPYLGTLSALRAYVA